MIGVDRTRLVVYLTAEERDRLVAEADAAGVDPSNHIRSELGLPTKDWGFRKDEFDRKLDRKVTAAVQIELARVSA